MLVMACDCKEAMGFPHEHEMDWGPWVERWTWNSNHDSFSAVPRKAEAGERGVNYGRPIPERFKISVDWREVAMALLGVR